MKSSKLTRCRIASWCLSATFMCRGAPSSLRIGKFDEGETKQGDLFLSELVAGIRKVSTLNIDMAPYDTY